MAHTDSSIEPGKLFVGGLSWDTKEDTFKEYFSKYGDVADVKIMEDPSTGKPRGFGFVTFHDPTSVLAVLHDAPHTIDGKKVDPKQATLKPPTNVAVKTKVFIGGLPTMCTREDVDSVCSGFGKVTGVDIKIENGADKNRGFCFVDFEKPDEASNLCKVQYITINGKKVEVKKAEPRNKSRNVQSDVPAQFPPGVYSTMGRGMGANTTGSAYYSYPGNPYQHPAYGNYPSAAQYGQYPDYSYGRGAYATQQGPMTSFPDTNTGYTPSRASYGTSTDQYSGATGFSGFEHLGYYADQSGGMNYTAHTTAQQRNNYTYGRS